MGFLVPSQSPTAETGGASFAPYGVPLYGLEARAPSRAVPGFERFGTESSRDIYGVSAPGGFSVFGPAASERGPVQPVLVLPPGGEVESLNVFVSPVTPPYVAPSVVRPRPPVTAEEIFSVEPFIEEFPGEDFTGQEI